MSETGNGVGRTRALVNYQEKSNELAQNLLLVASALDGLLHTQQCEKSEWNDENMADLIHACWMHITDAADHLRSGPDQEEQAGGGES